MSGHVLGLLWQGLAWQACGSSRACRAGLRPRQPAAVSILRRSSVPAQADQAAWRTHCVCACGPTSAQGTADPEYLASAVLASAPGHPLWTHVVELVSGACRSPPRLPPPWPSCCLAPS